VSSPKERLQKAAHRLAGSAAGIEEVICPSPDDGNAIPSDNLPEVIKAGLEEVRKFADEIEEIVK
jgi:hypothetical protein